MVKSVLFSNDIFAISGKKKSCGVCSLQDFLLSGDVIFSFPDPAGEGLKA